MGGLLKDMKLKLIEPLRECFKDEVRALGALMKIDEDLLWRHPFPGPGLGIRILGEVTPDQVRIARHADHIYITEIKKAGLYRDISQGLLLSLDYCAILCTDRRLSLCGRLAHQDGWRHGRCADMATGDCFTRCLLKRFHDGRLFCHAVGNSTQNLQPYHQ